MDDKTSIVSSTTIDPTCFRDDRKQIVKKKSRFSLFRGARVKARSSSNETTKQNKTSDDNMNNNDNKNNGNNIDLSSNESSSPQYRANVGSNPSSPSPSSTTSYSTMRKYASANNLQDLANMGMSPSVSNDNLQEAEGSMSHNVSPYNVSDRPTTRHKHSVSTGNIPELMSNGTMTYSKSTNNLQDLKFGMRRYASALNLLDLDMNEEVDAEEEGDDHVLENCAEDVMIDDKADQFIAQFYQQMKNQHKGKR